MSGDAIGFLNRFASISDPLGDMLRDNGSVLLDELFYQGPGDRYVVNTRLPQLSQERGAIQVSQQFAMAYANWLHHGQTDDPNSLFSGAYDLGQINADGSLSFTLHPTRQAGAKFAVASADELMKAGYYDPDRHGAG